MFPVEDSVDLGRFIMLLGGFITFSGRWAKTDIFYRKKCSGKSSKVLFLKQKNSPWLSEIFHWNTNSVFYY